MVKKYRTPLIISVIGATLFVASLILQSASWNLHPTYEVAVFFSNQVVWSLIRFMMPLGLATASFGVGMLTDRVILSRKSLDLSRQ
ncbi:hypothetical protein [Brevibacterium ammoniilyticum]|uniref:hypothetical protein n=1 Tax=Brevibacterium ammoniilyticum TaxID=1046555 RepID=UPI0031D4C1D7